MKPLRAPNWKVALGELLIVVVGILLAVQVDRWNTRRGEVAILQEYLDRIVLDLEADEQMFNALADHLLQGMAAADSLLAWMADPERRPTDARLRETVNATAVGSYQTGVRRGTFEDMLSTGALRLVADDSLRAALISYHEEYPGPQFRGVVDYWEEYVTLPLPALYGRHLDPRARYGRADAPAAPPLFVTDWRRLAGDADLARQLREMSAGGFDSAGFLRVIAEAARSLREQAIRAGGSPTP